LEEHERTLKELGSKLETSEANGQRLTFLYEQLSAQNASLKAYNEQIGERMQARDEDLAAAYEDIDGLRRQRRALLVIVAAVGVVVAGVVAVKVWRAVKAGAG
jgi:Flp pilus assembly protein TadB